MHALFTLCFMFLTTGVADSQSPGCSFQNPKQSFESSVPIPGTRRKGREKERTRHDSWDSAPRNFFFSIVIFARARHPQAGATAAGASVPRLVSPSSTRPRMSRAVLVEDDSLCFSRRCKPQEETTGSWTGQHYDPCPRHGGLQDKCQTQLSTACWGRWDNCQCGN
jgi:hypothetical protein